ncbi:class II histone deacetylase complex subunits 2 and 3-domain-containing protein [Scheffersomyces coipomensis]|uniref:class II histone deacetylase complex subunits 2 and 3-domain-containing protein n=1 Tax=Scheffersomyces coipomensis TaxID=1788519 RepID=UPI00315DE0A0
MNLLKILDGTPEPPIIELDLENVNESGDYHLPTPMYEFQKELTDQIVSLHYPDILKYCETNDTKELIVKSLEICIDNCMLVSTHPYLLINHYMPKNLTQKDLPNKLADTSGKFNVLRDLINVIISNSPSKTKNIAIVMKNNLKFFDLVDALLLGCSSNKNVKRYIGNNVQRESKKTNKGTDSNTTIHLLPHDGVIQRDEDQLEAVKFDTIIVFDGYVDTNHEFVKQIRSQNRRGEAIIIRLVPMKTIEHCKLYYENETGQKDHLYKLISAIVCLRAYIGNLPPDIFPIYNQKLTFLSSKFFDEVFRTSTRSNFPPWPLPDLPSIPRFTAIDVESSLLTEVHYHYTPYDSADIINLTEEEKAKKEAKPSYYESKRLQSDYVTNPLKNSYNQLIGIHSNGGNGSGFNNSSILTHKLIMQLNNAYLDMQRAEEEYNGYVRFNEQESQERSGRREDPLKKTISNIYDDIDHAEVRISTANKWIAKKSEEIETYKTKIKELEEAIHQFPEFNNIEKESNQKYIKNQLEIWELQNKTRELIRRISSKGEEKSFMQKEYQNSEKSIEDSEKEIEELKSQIRENKRKYESFIEQQEDESKEFEVKKKSITHEIKEERIRNEALKIKLNSSLKFLRDTSHLKKRKGRGLTPNSK